MTEPDVYPFGDEITSTSNDREKFATYTRDTYTGPTCSISLYERPTPFIGSPGLHTYLAVSTTNPITGATSVEDIEGGPSPSYASIGGKLTGTIAPPGLGLNSGSSNDATNPNLPSNVEVGNAYTGANACALASQLTADVGAYNSGPKVTYNFSTVGGGYNSNSFTYTLDSQIGLLNYFGSPLSPLGTAIPWVPGWGKLVPGL